MDTSFTVNSLFYGLPTASRANVGCSPALDVGNEFA